MSRRVERVRSRPRSAAAQIEGVVAWYFREIYGKVEGPGCTPFYCDPTIVGAFAVEPEELARGTDEALFRLFVAMAMFQALRDVVIMRQQRMMPRRVARALTSITELHDRIASSDCSTLRSVDEFTGCSVSKTGRVVDCHHQPGRHCHVKDATTAFNRMGDMGKLPTSAWLVMWKNAGLARLLDDLRRTGDTPTRRAEQLVDRLARVHRVGRKLATMFVSALSTPALAPGLTPWSPHIDGNELVVIDTNVSRALSTLRREGGGTYSERERWVRRQAARLDLRQFHPAATSYSPRLVQQALYAYCSKSNRAARRDACASLTSRCSDCFGHLCPFGGAG